MLITNFASGELSPNLNGRVDIAQYYQGAARIENFEIIPTGGIKRRPGTQLAKKLNDNCRIIPFIVDKNNVYILEIGIDSSSNTCKIKILAKHGLDAFYSVIYTINNAPWLSLAEINELQYAQNYDTMIFVHRDYRPYTLKFNGADSFSFSYMSFNFVPTVEVDDDFDYVMIVAGTDFPIKSTGTVVRFSYYRMVNGARQLYVKTFSENVTEYWCVVQGKLYSYDLSSDEWLPYGTDPEVDTTLFTDSVSKLKYPGCVTFFNNRLFFASTKSERQKIWASAAPDNIGVRYTDFSTYKKYVTVNKVVRDADLHLFTASIAQANIDTTNHITTLNLVSQDFTAEGVLSNPITDYYITCSAAQIPIGTKVLSCTTNTIVINTDKCKAGSDYSMTIQLWRDADTVSSDDFKYTVVANNVTTADCALFFELASDQNDAIMFLSSNRFLAVGTESSIWSVDAGINALNINAIMQGRFGSDDLQGQAIETATVYFAQGRKGIREFYYDGEAEAFKTNNIALLADHLLRESAVKDFDYATNPYSRLVIVRADGKCVQMLYDKTNNIMAWSRITLGNGEIKSCAVTRGYDENDLIFFVVKRGNDYYLELLDFGNQVYLDCWELFTNDSLLDYHDGAILYNVTTEKTCPYDNIPTGFINTGDVVYIGYPFTSYIKSMPVIGNDPSKRVRITALLVRFLNSYKPVMKCTGLSDEKFNSIQSVPYSGIAKANYPGITDHDVCFELETNDVKPVNILGVDAQTA